MGGEIMTEDESDTARAIGRVLANLPGAGAASEAIARGALVELQALVRGWDEQRSPFPPPPEIVEARPVSHTASDCPFCEGLGVVTAARTRYDPRDNKHHKIGERTIPCPNGCNPDHVARIVDHSQRLMDDASRDAGLTPARRPDDGPPEPKPDDT